MNKKAIVVLIIVLISTFGCSSNKEEGEKTSSSETKTERAESVPVDPEMEIMLGVKKEEVRPPTSYDLIQEELDNQKISEQDAMILRIIAGFTPEDLPEKYQSAETPSRSVLQEAVIWLDKNYHSLDDDTQKVLKPYYVLPDHPESYLNSEKPADTLKDKLSTVIKTGFMVSEAVAAAPAWNKIEAAAGAAKADIFYKSADLEQANHVKASFEKSTPKFEKLLNVHVPKTVFYIVPIKEWGLQTVRDIGGVECSYIRIRKGLNEERTLSTTAHEAFHSHQVWMYLDYVGERKWLMEATATWAQDYAYPDKNVEHLLLPRFFINLGKDMVYFGNGREYSTYVWPWFLTQYYNNPALIRTMLLKSRNGDSRKAATTGIIKKHFDRIFADYALWNVNKFTAKYYKDTKPIIDTAFRSETYRFGRFGDETREEPFSIATEPLSSQYLGFMFQGSKKIIIDMNEIAPDNVKRRALIKKDGRWQKRPEDWSYIKRKKFCSEREGENIEGIILITSNADLYNGYYNNLTVKVYDDCEPGWHGTTTITWDDEKTENVVTVGGVEGTVRKVRKGKYVLRDTLNMVEPEEDDDTDYSARIQTTSIDYYSFYEMTQTLDGNCGLVKKVFEKTESGTLELDYSEEDSIPNRLYYDTDSPDDGVTLYFDLNVDYDWIREREVATYKYNQNCSRLLKPEKDRTSITEKYDNLLTFYPVEGIKTKLPFEDTFKGTHTFIKKAKGMSYEVTVEYDYEFE